MLHVQKKPFAYSGNSTTVIWGESVSFSQLKEMEQSHQEATEKEVERILGILQTHFENDRKYN